MRTSKFAFHAGIAVLGLCFIAYERLYVGPRESITRMSCEHKASYDKFGGKFCGEDNFVFVTLAKR